VEHVFSCLVRPLARPRPFFSRSPLFLIRYLGHTAPFRNVVARVRLRWWWCDSGGGGRRHRRRHLGHGLGKYGIMIWKYYHNNCSTTNGLYTILLSYKTQVPINYQRKSEKIVMSWFAENNRFRVEMLFSNNRWLDDFIKNIRFVGFRGCIIPLFLSYTIWKWSLYCWKLNKSLLNII